MTTLDRIKAHLTAGAYFSDSTFCRENFKTANGITVSIQQSATHYSSLRSSGFVRHTGANALAPDVSDTATVEMWCCPRSELLDTYGGDDGPYAYVPLTVVAAYIDQLEGVMPTKTTWPAAAEVLTDIARTIGSYRLCRDGDSRDDYPLMCQWADEFQSLYDANPDACETYYEDVEAFTIAKAQAAAFTASVSATPTDQGHTMTALHKLQAGDILSSAEVEQIRAVADSLAWIAQFCNEHPEWFGVGDPDDSAEHEWLETANKLTKDAS